MDGFAARAGAADVRFPETPRSRKLSLQEIEWFLHALVDEESNFQRGMLLWLLTAARISEVAKAHSSELIGDDWVIPDSRTKNSFEHRISLGPWGRSLMKSNTEWVFPAQEAGPAAEQLSLVQGARSGAGADGGDCRAAAQAVHAARFSAYRAIQHKTPQGRLRDPEAMMNHAKKGLERAYDTYELEEEKRVPRWEAEIAGIAVRLGLREALGVPCADSGRAPSPQGARFEPGAHIGEPETRTSPIFVGSASQLIFSGEVRWTTAPQSVDLALRQPKISLTSSRRRSPQ